MVDALIELELKEPILDKPVKVRVIDQNFFELCSQRGRQKFASHEAFKAGEVPLSSYSRLKVAMRPDAAAIELAEVDIDYTPESFTLHLN